MSGVALDEVAVHLPPQRVPIASIADRLGIDRIQVKLMQRVHGLSEVRLDTGGSLLDLLSAAVSRLDALRGREHLVRYVIHARGMPVAVPYPDNPLHELCRRLGLGHAVAFTVSQQACASGLLAIDLAGRLLAGCDDPEALALVLAGEKTFTWDAQVIPRTAVFGEGASACLVRRGGERDRLLSYVARIHGEFTDRISVRPERAAAFQRIYPDLLAEVLLAAVAQAGRELTDLRVILPHNVNVVSWKRLCQLIDLPVDRVLLDNVPVTGHSFCADAFINYHTAMERGMLRPGDAYLMVAVGHGATFSAMVFEH
jgi:3-oxoacyl-[acyl-carrier-protein] synthase-3